MNYKNTHHFEARCQQRSINKEVLEILFSFGKTVRHKGADVTFMNKRAKKLAWKVSNHTRSALEKAEKAYVVEEGGRLITVGFKTRHFKT